MNRKQLKMRFFLLVAIVTLFATSSSAQTLTDDDIKGVWVYVSFKVGDKSYSNDFSSIKIYGNDGEYCCAQVGVLRSGTYKIIPHDYGTYVYRNGEYTECGRKGNLNLTSRTTFNGEWMGRLEFWQKVDNFPAKLRNYIIEECKKAVLGDPAEYQPLIEKYWLKRGE